MKDVHLYPPSSAAEGGFIKSGIFGLIFFMVFFLSFVYPGIASPPVAAEINKIEIEGNQLIEAARIKKVISSKPGTTLSLEKIRKDIQAIYDMGYFSSVKVLREEVSQGVVLIYEVKEYPMVEDIEFTGVQNSSIKNELTRMVTLKKNQPWNYKHAEQSRRKILDYFKKQGYTQAQVDFSAPQKERLEEKESFVATFSVDKGQKALVMEVEISGNRFFSDPKIRSFMSTGFKARFDPETLKKDIEKVVDEYQKKGFYFAQIKVDQYKFFERYRVKWARVFLEVNEGQRYRMGSLQTKGNEIFSDTQIKAAIRPAKGDIFNTAMLKRSLRRVQDMYGQKGYLYAKVDNSLHFNPENRTVDVELSIQENHQVTVGDIRVAGNEKTEGKVFKHTLLLDSGDIFDTKKMIESWRRLYNLGFFKEVQMQPIQTSNPEVLDLMVKVKEKEKTGKLLLGASYSANLGLEGFVQFSKDNLWGEGKKLSVDWQFGGTRSSYQIGYLDRWWEDTPTTVELSLYKDQSKFYRDEDEGYTKNTAGGSIKVGRPWISNFEISLRFRRETANIKSIEGKTLPEGLTVGERTYQSIKPSLTWDSRVRDEAFNSYRGFYGLASVEKSGGFMGGDVDFTKYSAELRSYSRYGKLWSLPVFALRMRGKWGSSLPVDEEFHIGGQDTLRGYEAGQFTGSNAYLGTAELRFPLAQNMLSYLFVDAGKTSTMHEYKVGYGFGLRINSAIGVLRFDYGIGEEGDPRFYFGMGDVF